MTKHEALAGVLTGTYDAVRASNFGPREYVYLNGNVLMKSMPGDKSMYNDMSNLDDPTWEEFFNKWYENIPDTGLLVFVNNSGTYITKRASGYTAPNIEFDDNTTADASVCSLYTSEEIQELYRNLNSI